MYEYYRRILKKYQVTGEIHINMKIEFRLIFISNEKLFPQNTIYKQQKNLQYNLFSITDPCSQRIPEFDLKKKWE